MKKKIFVDKWLVLLVLFSLVLRISYLILAKTTLLWDASVYIGIGKYIYSLGGSGLFEPARPPILPIMLGIGWKIGFNPFIFGLVLETIFGIGTIILCYKIAEQILGKKCALISSIILSFTPFFIYYNSTVLSGIPSTFFALLSIYLFIKNKNFLAGIFSSIAFLTRFPQGLVFIFLLLFSKNMKNFLKILFGFILILAPYLIVNYILFGNPLHPFFEASLIIKNAGLWLYKKRWYFYFVEILKNNPLLFFSFVGLFTFPKEKRKYFMLICVTIAMFFYFSKLQHKEIRFAIVFLPYLSIFASTGVIKILEKINKKIFSFSTVGIVMLSLVILFWNLNIEKGISNEELNFYSYFKDKNERILTSNPVVALFSDAKLDLMYYPIFNFKKAKELQNYILKHKKKIKYILLDECYGLVCEENDQKCKEERNKLQKLIEKYFKKIYENKRKCKQIIYELKTYS